jgi:hypothetical protein
MEAAYNSNSRDDNSNSRDDDVVAFANAVAEEESTSNSDDDDIAAVVRTNAAVACLIVSTTDIIVHSGNSLAPDHRTQPRKKRRVFDHYGALQCIQREYLRPHPLILFCCFDINLARELLSFSIRLAFVVPTGLAKLDA